MSALQHSPLGLRENLVVVRLLAEPHAQILTHCPNVSEAVQRENGLAGRVDHEPVLRALLLQHDVHALEHLARRPHRVGCQTDSIPRVAAAGGGEVECLQRAVVEVKAIPADLPYECLVRPDREVGVVRRARRHVLRAAAHAHDVRGTAVSLAKAQPLGSVKPALRTVERQQKRTAVGDHRHPPPVVVGDLLRQRLGIPGSRIAEPNHVLGVRPDQVRRPGRTRKTILPPVAYHRPDGRSLDPEREPPRFPQHTAGRDGHYPHVHRVPLPHQTDTVLALGVVPGLACLGKPLNAALVAPNPERRDEAVPHQRALVVGYLAGMLLDAPRQHALPEAGPFPTHRDIQHNTVDGQPIGPGCEYGVEPHHPVVLDASTDGQVGPPRRRTARDADAGGSRFLNRQTPLPPHQRRSTGANTQLDRPRQQRPPGGQDLRAERAFAQDVLPVPAVHCLLVGPHVRPRHRHAIADPDAAAEPGRVRRNGKRLHSLPTHVAADGLHPNLVLTRRRIGEDQPYPRETVPVPALAPRSGNDAVALEQSSSHARPLTHGPCVGVHLQPSAQEERTQDYAELFLLPLNRRVVSAVQKGHFRLVQRTVEDHQLVDHGTGIPAFGPGPVPEHELVPHVHRHQSVGHAAGRLAVQVQRQARTPPGPDHVVPLPRLPPADVGVACALEVDVGDRIVRDDQVQEPSGHHVLVDQPRPCPLAPGQARGRLEEDVEVLVVPPPIQRLHPEGHRRLRQAVIPLPRDPDLRLAVAHHQGVARNPGDVLSHAVEDDVPRAGVDLRHD